MLLERSKVLEALRALDRADRDQKVFGATKHQYKLNPPVDHGIIEAFETNRKILLPADYRHFICQIGNGGAGPFYGVFPFGMYDGLGDSLSMWEDGLMTGDVASPFRHTTDWNPPDSFWERSPNLERDISSDEEDKLMKAWDRELEEHYWNPKIMNGAIPICHIGRALRRWLVVTGKEKGNVWWDHRADEDGIGPVKDATGERLTFSRWYQTWLDDPNDHTKIL